ncbi:hypothetical protein [Micromonospora inyonensis]|uniref:LPXTG-motif cell wall anchor domain-containing protein n=1 Tax=Micromonospora inyonensis TaxID=47866 RepID=A0A1C6SCZ0_9ACTN|nr:hypothetical protein [Micromonospora inyonensis]SCL27318.1 hypothetical protein GA0074694_4778 [Micromonospora inyonensis]
MRLSRIITTIAVGLAVAATPSAAGAALSQPQPPPYQPPAPTLTVSPSTVDVGEIATVTGRGFGSRELVEITITTGPLAAGVPGQSARRSDGSTVALAPVAFRADEQPQPGGGNPPEHVPSKGPWDGSHDGARQVFWIRADVDGFFEFAFRARHPGKITITARGLTSGRTASAVLTVLKPYDHGKGPLPVTGSSMETPLKVGGGLVGVGAVLLLTTFALRRRNRVGTGATS